MPLPTLTGHHAATVLIFVWASFPNACRPWLGTVVRWFAGVSFVVRGEERAAGWGGGGRGKNDFLGGRMGQVAVPGLVRKGPCE